MENSSSPKISIAMATYNGEAYLKEQLYSFVSQTQLPDEVVASDDNSTDRTVEILRAFKKEAPFEVKIIEKDENVGYKKNFERALQHVTGDLIFMSDQDDVWFKHKIERIIHHSEQYPNSQVFINDTELTDGNLNPSGITKIDQIKVMGMGTSTMVMGTCTAIKKSFLSLILPIPGNYNAGHDDWIHDFGKIFDIRKIIPETLQYYRIHGSNISTSVVNTPKKINFIRFYYEKINSDDSVKKSLVKRLNRAIILEKWISKNSTKIEKVIENRLDPEEILLILKEEIEVLQNRIQVLSIGRLKRLRMIGKLLLNKQYHTYFSGLKSAIYDLLKGKN